MRFSITHFLLFILLVVFAVGCPSQQQEAEARATFDVQDMEQFVPGWWTVTLTAPRNKSVAIRSAPSLQVQVWHDGEWLGFGDLGDPARRNGPGGGGAYSPRARVLLEAGESETWKCELMDWTVLGWVGRYRARASWGEGTHPHRMDAVGRSDWAEFTVSTGAAGGELEESRDSEGDLWKQYKLTMSVLPTSFLPPAAGGVWREKGLGLGVREMLAMRGPECWELLAKASELPQGVRDRIEFLRAVDEWRLAAQHDAGAERRRALHASLGRLEALTARGVVDREFAWMLKIDVLRGLGETEKADGVREMLRSVPSVQDVARPYPGVWEKLIRGSANDPNHGGPGFGPRK